MELLKLSKEESGTRGVLCWYSVGDTENPLAKSRMKLRHFSSVFAKISYDGAIDTGVFDKMQRKTIWNYDNLKPGIFYCSGYTCSREFGFLSQYDTDLYTEEEVSYLTNVFDYYNGFFYDSGCCLPPNLLSERCKRVLCHINDKRLDTLIPISLILNKVNYDNLENGDIIFNNTFPLMSGRLNKLAFLNQYGLLKLPNSFPNSSSKGPIRLDGLIMGDSCVMELRRTLNIDFREWIEVVPTWFSEIENQINFKRNMKNECIHIR